MHASEPKNASHFCDSAPEAHAAGLAEGAHEIEQPGRYKPSLLGCHDIIVQHDEPSALVGGLTQVVPATFVLKSSVPPIAIFLEPALRQKLPPGASVGYSRKILNGSARPG
jgi:hypothetical protein